MRIIGARLVLLFAALIVMTASAHAFVPDKSALCVQMADKAEAFLQEKGKAYALKVFSVSEGPFIHKGLYVFACSMDNKLLAHPYRSDMVGENVNQVQDVKGKFIFQEFKKIARQQGSGWVDYYWNKPGEKGVFPKETYIKRIPALNIYVGVGYYK
jgi:cytochrome c